MLCLFRQTFIAFPQLKAEHFFCTEIKETTSKYHKIWPKSCCGREIKHGKNKLFLWRRFRWISQSKSSLTCKEVVERCSAVKLKWKQYDMYETCPIGCITESTQDISHKANIPALPLGTKWVKSVKADKGVPQFDQTLCVCFSILHFKCSL